MSGFETGRLNCKRCFELALSGLEIFRAGGGVISKRLDHRLIDTTIVTDGKLMDRLDG